jgi:hypothetical protein
MDEAPLTWEALEHAHVPKENDWYWSLGIITVALACVIFFFGNILFGVLILIAGVTFGILAKKGSPLVTFTIEAAGIRVNNAVYSYDIFKHFAIVEREFDPPLIVCDTNVFLTPHLYIPLTDDIDVERVREKLAAHIPEVERGVPFVHRLTEAIGL